MTTPFSSRMIPSGALLAALLLAPALPALAQDPELVGIGRQVWVQKANCRSCHGIMGNGDHEDPRAPIGADLRQTTLNAEQLVEVIKCGRPDTPMPYFDRKAYTDTRCYESTAEQLGDATPPPGTPALSARDIQSLTAFILADLAGHGEPTREDCQALWGAAATSCEKYQ